MALLTVEEVAEKIKMSPFVVRRWLRERKLPGIKMGRVWRIDEKDLEKFLDKNRK